MSKLAAPLIIAAHLGKLPTLPAWQAVNGTRDAVVIGDGPLLRADDPAEWLSVGYVSTGGGAPATTFEAVTDAQGSTRDAGSVSSELVVAAADVPTARARTFALLQEWQQWLSTDRTIGGAVTSGEAHLLVDVALDVTRGGGRAISVVTVTYRATTYG